MIRVALVSVVEKPDVSERSNLSVRHVEEAFKVTGLLTQFRQPDHCWHIRLRARQERAIKSHLA